MKSNWLVKKLGEVIGRSINSPKIKKDDYKNLGRFPIIDQNQSFIAGYTDNESYLYAGELPVIIFGDHTQVIKYIDKPFARGADGTKVITTDINQTNPKFLFYIMSNLKLESHGYSRHFQYLVEKELIVPPLQVQRKIVERLDAIRKAQELCDQQIQKTEELFESISLTEIGSFKKTRKLGELVSFQTGKLNSNAAKPDGKYSFFTCAQETFKTNTYSFDTECVLLGGNNASGVFPIKYFSGKFDAYQRTYIIKSTDKKFLSNVYLYFSLRLMLGLFQKLSVGGSTRFLTLTVLKNIDLPLPTIKEQKKIVEKLEAVQNYKKLLLKQKVYLRELFDSVLDKSMKGELDINVQ